MKLNGKEGAFVFDSSWKQFHKRLKDRTLKLSHHIYYTTSNMICEVNTTPNKVAKLF